MSVRRLTIPSTSTFVLMPARSRPLLRAFLEGSSATASVMPGVIDSEDITLRGPDTESGVS